MDTIMQNMKPDSDRLNNPNYEIAANISKDENGQYQLMVKHPDQTQELLPLLTSDWGNALCIASWIMAIIKDSKQAFSFIIEDQGGSINTKRAERKIQLYATNLAAAKNAIINSPLGKRCLIINEDQKDVALHKKMACFYRNGTPKVQFIWLQAKSSEHAKEKFAQKFPHLTLVELATKNEFNQTYKKYFQKN